MSNAPIPIMVKVWAGKDPHDFRYIRRSLPSLLASGLPENAHIVLVNDRSPDTRLEPFLRGLAAARSNVELWTNPERLGPDRGQEYNFPLVAARFPDAPYYLLCDDDIIYHPGWLQRLVRVYEEARARGVTGVFAALNIPFRPHYESVRLPTSEVLLKHRQPALNWLLPRDVYATVGPFRDTGVAYDTDYTNRLIERNIPVVCLRPSYVQNIGYHGAYQSDDRVTAPDYVGRRDLYLWGRDCLYSVRRHTVDRFRRWIDHLPDSRWKRMGLSAARRVRSVFSK
jgi:glycosyltransferase involved in cell wall biosynthesis